MNTNRGHWGRGSDGGLDGCSQPTNHSLAVDFALPSCYLCSPFLTVCLNNLTPAVSSHRPPLVTLSYSRLSLFNSIFCLLSSVCKNTVNILFSPFLSLLTPSFHVSPNIYFPRILTQLYFLFLPSRLILFCRSSLFVNSCIMSFSLFPLSLSPSTSLHSHALFPCSSLLFGCRYHSYLQMPAAPHRGHVIQQSLPHQKKKLHSCLLPHIFSVLVP